MIALFFIALNLTLLGLILYLRRHHLISQFYGRKLLHVLSALGAIIAVSVVSQLTYLFVCLLFTLFYSWLNYRHQLVTLEIKPAGNLGAPLFPLGLFIMAAVLWPMPSLHYLGILLLGVPDVFGAAAEEFFKPTHLFRAKIIKIIVYFSVTAVIMYLFKPFFPIILIAGILTLVENKSDSGWDNITVPAVYTLLILALNPY